MLRWQAMQYAQTYSVDGLDDFKASSSWVSNFKQKYLTLKIKEGRGDTSPDIYRDEELQGNSRNETAQTFTSVFPVGPPTTSIVSTSRKDSTVSPDNDENAATGGHVIVEKWSLPTDNNSMKEPPEVEQAMDETDEDIEIDDMPDYTDDFNDTITHFDKIDNESTDKEISSTTSKLDAKKHLEAALAFYRSQAETNTSMSANMIKLILQNDFEN
jgi:hypothetical protein